MNSNVRSAYDVIQRWFASAVEVVDPRQAVTRALSYDGRMLRVGSTDIPLAGEGRLVVLAIGKAAPAMARGAREMIGERIDHGIILTKYGHLSQPVDGFDAFEAGHPMPDEGSLAATQRILEEVSDLTERDTVIALISGGGSALLELPRDGVSLEDMQMVTHRLMHAGAGIHDLNAVRKELSQVKGGGLRRAIGPARCISLLLSDVLGNDPSVIASGPTVISSSPGDDAPAVIEKFGLRGALPGAITARLPEGGVRDSDIDVHRDMVEVIADNAIFVREIANRANADGYRVELNADPYSGDAAEWGREFVQQARKVSSAIDVLVRGGEATVKVTGDGTGGRNTEMALAATFEMTADDRWIVASLASDGDDGNSEAAGAIADPGTLNRARDHGIDPEQALRQNDSASVFQKAGGLVVTGPTGTNVNDVYIALRTNT